MMFPDRGMRLDDFTSIFSVLESNANQQLPPEKRISIRMAERYDDYSDIQQHLRMVAENPNLVDSDAPSIVVPVKGDLYDILRILEQYGDLRLEFHADTRSILVHTER